MRTLVVFLLLLIGSNLWAQQTVQLHLVCGESNVDCISVKTIDGKHMLVQQSPAIEWESRDITEIRSVTGDRGNQAILLSLSNEATKKLADLTRANLHRQLAIIADGRIITAPTINATIEGGPLQIASDSNQIESPLLRVSWVKTRLAEGEKAAASTLKVKMAMYISFGLLLALGALYFAFFRKTDQPVSKG